MNQKSNKKGEITTQIQYRLIEEITARKQAEENLRESEERFRSLFENSTIGLYRTTPDGRILLANPTLVQMLGYSSFEELSALNLEKEDFEIRYSRSEFIKRIEQEGQIKGFETTWQKHDGTLIYIRESAKVIRDEEGAIRYYEGTVEDITERKLAEEALRESEEKYRGIFDESVASIYLFDAQKNFINSNQAGLDLLGYSRDELLKMSIPQVDADPETELPAHNKLLAGDRIVNYEHKLKRKDGSIITVLNNSRPITNIDGNVIGMQSTLIDVTERKLAEVALKSNLDQTRRLRDMVEKLNRVNILQDAYSIAIESILAVIKADRTSILISDPDGVVRFKAWKGLSPEYRTAVEGHFPWELSDLKAQPITIQNISEADLSKELRDIVLKEGIHACAFIPLIGKDQLLGKFMMYYNREHTFESDEMNVTQVLADNLSTVVERLQSQDALVESEIKYRSIFESSIDIYYQQNKDGIVTIVSPSVRQFGYEPKDIIGTRGVDYYLDLVDRERLIVKLEKEGIVKDYEVKLKDAWGNPVWTSVNVRILRDEEENFIGMDGVLRVINERKLAEQALRESEEKFRTLSESIQAIPYRYNIKQDQFTYIGKQVKRILGYSVDSWTDLESWSNRIHHDDREPAINYCLTAYKEGNDHNFEYRFLTSRGETVWIHDIITVRKDENGSPVESVGFMVDITERKQAEEEIRLLLTITQAINEAEDFNSALEITLRKVCEATKWDYGEAWIPRSDGTKLECCPVGYCSTESLEEFRRLSQEYTFAPGTGLPGRVWSSKHPEWIPNVSTEAKTFFPRSKKALNAGLKAAIGVPIIIDNEVLAVLAFYMYEHRKEEKHLIELISTVAAQLGSVIQRKQGEEALIKSEEKFRGVIEQSNDGLYVLQGDRFVFINPRFTEITGFELDEISSEDFDFKKLFAKEGLKVLEEREAKHKRGEKLPGRYVFKGLRKDGQKRDLEVSVTMVEWQGAPATLGVLHDVTNRIQIRTELQKALEDAKQANSVKSLFMANMSHEIRTPLNAILGFTDLIETSTRHLVSKEEKGFFDTIRNSGNRLMDTVHEILDISQIEAGTYDLKLEHINLVKLVRNMIRECQSMADKKGLKVEYTSEIESAFIKADQYSMSQAICNIIDNAVKYTEQGEINILLKQSSKQYVLTIQDTGIGIAEEYIEDLYNAFSQESEGYTKKYQGIGLGMAITKRHLELNNVDIDVVSTKSVGTTFTLAFKPAKKPLHKEKQIKQKEARDIPTAEAVDKQLVLLVEDDTSSQQLTKFFLQETYDIYFAMSVKEAKQQLKKYPIDLILLDLSLVGNEDGLDLVRWMRKTKTWKKIPVIATTAHAFTKDQNNCLAAGCNDYLPKPIKREKLLEKIRAFV